MGYVKYLYIFSMLVFFSLNTMEVEPASTGCMVYIYNKSNYPVRICVGPDYPPSIALDAGQIFEFPIEKLETIIASSYGKYTNFLSGIVAKLDFKALIKDNKEIVEKDHLVTITYEEEAPSGFLWFVKYLFTQGKWSLSIEEFNYQKHTFDEDKNKTFGSIEDLYKKIKSLSYNVSDDVAHDAALIWSMFPRAAMKIMLKNPVYPFNILSLDIGGLVASEEQLHNWADLLFSMLKKQFSDVKGNAIWNAVNMLISDAIESIYEGKYYAQRDPAYLIRLLNRYDFDKDNEVELPIELITQLKQQVKDNSALAILAQLESAAIKKKIAPSPVPTAPAFEHSKQKNYKENSISRYLETLEKKRPEEETLLDKVVTKLFGLINQLNDDNISKKYDLERKNIIIDLQYSALQKLQLIAQHKRSIQQLKQIFEFINKTMIYMILLEDNRSVAMQEWIGRLGSCKRKNAYHYAQLSLADLQEFIEKENEDRQHQHNLMLHLKQQIAKFQEPE